MKEPIITLDNEMHDRHELTQKARLFISCKYIRRG